jgi:hypothetical protein
MGTGLFSVLAWPCGRAGYRAFLVFHGADRVLAGHHARIRRTSRLRAPSWDRVRPFPAGHSRAFRASTPIRSAACGIASPGSGLLHTEAESGRKDRKRFPVSLARAGEVAGDRFWLPPETKAGSPGKERQDDAVPMDLRFLNSRFHKKGTGNACSAFPAGGPRSSPARNGWIQRRKMCPKSDAGVSVGVRIREGGVPHRPSFRGRAPAAPVSELEQGLALAGGYGFVPRPERGVSPLYVLEWCYGGLPAGLAGVGRADACTRRGGFGSASRQARK